MRGSSKEILMQNALIEKTDMSAIRNASYKLSRSKHKNNNTYNNTPDKNFSP